MSFFLSVTLLLFVSNPKSFAQADGETTGGGGTVTVPDAQPSNVGSLENAHRNTPANISGAVEDGKSEAVQSASVIAKKIFESRTDKLEITSQTESNINKFKTEIGSIQTLEEASDRTYRELIGYINLCEEYGREASTCCSGPEQCAEKTGDPSIMDKFGTPITIFGGLAVGAFGGGDLLSGIASCTAAASSAFGAYKSVTSKNLICGFLRAGSAPKMGCKRTCELVGELVKSMSDRVQTLSNVEDELQRANLSNLLLSKRGNVQLGLQTCVKDTSKGQAQAAGSLNEITQSISSMQSCMEAFASDEKINPTSISSNSDIANADLSGGGGIQKVSDSQINAIGSISDDVDEPPLPENLNDQNTADAQQENQGQGGGFGGGGAASAGAGGGSNGNQQKAARRRGVAKADGGLISGYGKSSATSGSRAKGSKYKPRKFNFGSSSKAKANASERARNFKLLAKRLAAAGISPNSQDNIFARTSYRFQASSVKEKLFDAKQNKKPWMKK